MAQLSSIDCQGGGRGLELDAQTTAPDQLRLNRRGYKVRSPWVRNLLTFLMVFGPGLIVMEADNDAGAVSTSWVLLDLCDLYVGGGFAGADTGGSAPIDYSGRASASRDHFALGHYFSTAFAQRPSALGRPLD